MCEESSFIDNPHLLERLELACRQIDERQYIQLDEEGLDQFFAELLSIATGPSDVG